MKTLDYTKGIAIIYYTKTCGYHVIDYTQLTSDGRAKYWCHGQNKKKAYEQYNNILNMKKR